MTDKPALDPLFCGHHWHKDGVEDHMCGEPGRQMYRCCDCKQPKSSPPNGYETRLELGGHNAD